MQSRSNNMSTSIAVGYVRASTNKQRYSAAAQHAEIADWSSYNAIPVVETEADPETTSAIDPRDRPGFSRLLQTIRRLKADFLLVVDRDRLGREVWYMSAIEKELSELDPPCRILETTEDPTQTVTPETELHRGMKDVLAQYERAKIRIRTRRGVRQAALAGKVAGPKKWSTFRRGQQTIQLVKRLHTIGMSNAAIVRFCEVHTILSPHRGVITAAHVRKCLADDYRQADLDETVDSLLDSVRRAPYYESKFVPGDDTDRKRVHSS